MWIVLGLAVFLALMTVGGDYLVLMSIRKPDAMMALVVAAVLLYGLQAFGWRFIFQQVSIATAAVLYSSLTTILLVLFGGAGFQGTCIFAHTCRAGAGDCSGCCG